jgi:hypothetical protein
MDAWGYTSQMFKDKAESENPGYTFVRVAYLTTGLWCEAIMRGTDGRTVTRRMYF